MFSNTYYITLGTRVKRAWSGKADFTKSDTGILKGKNKIT